MIETFGPKRLSQITYLDLEKYRNARKGIPTWRGETRSDARVNREMAVLKHMLNKAVEWACWKARRLKKARS
jgi:hypothetical protein